MSKKEVLEVLANFEKALITPEILKLNRLNPDNYVGISKSLDAFKATKNYILSQLEEPENFWIKPR